eukprot:CAMPEP_0194126528 /NCGR_PEP_ID=MMETSP0150-20130528/60037_1 /TAXON_ID=122233 /ORGANISM="Chaetoceros debilis, Strain MM31A-1" /LENGTH=982 /DNA_ID=CAMNT_0038820395 /DNA_START=47 /DNA_END=2995 /DNA_ORIENTATION=+
MGDSKKEDKDVETHAPTEPSNTPIVVRRSKRVRTPSSANVTDTQESNPKKKRKRRISKKMEEFQKQKVEKKIKKESQKIKPKRKYRKRQKKANGDECVENKIVKKKKVSKPVEKDEESSLDEKDMVCCICRCSLDYSDKDIFDFSEDGQHDAGEITVDDEIRKQEDDEAYESMQSSSAAPLSSTSKCENDSIDKSCIVVHKIPIPNQQGAKESSIVSREKEESMATQSDENVNNLNKKDDSTGNGKGCGDSGDSDDDKSEGSNYFGIKLPKRLHDNSNALLICDGVGCNRCYHQRCHFVPVLCVPKREWFCLICQMKDKLKMDKKGKSKRGRKPKPKPKPLEKDSNILISEVDDDFEISKSAPLVDADFDSLYRISAQSTAVSSKEIESTKAALGQVDNRSMPPSNQIVLLQNRFEFHSAPLKSEIIQKELSSKIKSAINQNFSQIRLSQNSIRALTETNRARKAIIDNYGITKRLPQTLIQNFYKFAQSKLRLRDLMLNLHKIIQNQNDVKVVEDWLKKTNEVEKSISCSNDNTAQSAISQSSSEVQPSSPLKTSGIKEIEPTSSNRSPTTLNSVPKIISLQSPKIGTLRTDSKTSSNIDVGAINKKLFVGKCTRVEPRFDIKDYDADEDESDAEESDIPADKIKCFVCSSGHAEDDNDVLMCDGKGCFRAMHMKCRLPNVTQATLDQDESGTFFCPFCTCFATALHYIETEFYADERGLKDDDEEQDNTHQDHSSNKSWEQAEEVFPESVEEFEVAEKWMEGLDDDRSSRIISTCLGIEVAGEETSAAQGAGAEIYDDHEEDDESDTDFCSQSRKEDNESISGSDDESSGVNWNIESSELSELPPSQIGSESEDDSQEDDGKKIRRSRRRLGKDNEIQPGKKIDGGTLDTSNIVRGKRRRTSVDYNKLNDAMFGEGGAIRATKDIDDEEDYHFVTKAEPTDGDSNCSSDSDEDCSKSSGSSDGNNSLGNSSTSKTSKGLG